ncbi:hypothetical protein [Hydrocarboniphaga sp.]|uniref:hypothetical protein n=1 Tax=Hydrocarboniphaga sp. TaxID=2033016 RepID=UPI003D119BEA
MGDHDMVKRYVVVNEAGETINVVLWDGETDFDPGEGMRLIPQAEAPPSQYVPAPTEQSE